MGNGGKTELTSKEKADLLIKLAASEFWSHDTRRQYEWKVNLALWPALALYSGFMLKGEVALPVGSVGKWVVYGLLTAIFGVYVWPWSWGVQRRNKENIHWEMYYLGLADDQLGVAPKEGSDLKPRKWEDRPFWKSWSHMSQIFFTFLLTVIAILATCAAAGIKEKPRQSSGSPVTLIIQPSPDRFLLPQGGRA